MYNSAAGLADVLGAFGPVLLALSLCLYAGGLVGGRDVGGSP